MFKTLALSSLAAVSIAGTSLFSDLGTVPLKPSEALDFEISVSAPAVQLADPLELASTYAQETLEDWKATLNQYDEALKSKWNFIELEQGEPVEGAFTISVGNGADEDVFHLDEEYLDEGLSLRAAGDGSVSISKVKLDELDDLLNLDWGQTVELSDAVIFGEAIHPVHIESLAEREGVSSFSELDEIEPASELVQVATFTSSASPTAKALFEARINLGEVAQSGDASAIRSALAELLDLYKQEIANLTAE